MKRGNLVEYNMKNHVPNMAQKLVLDPFLKKLKQSVTLDQQSEVLCSLFLLYVQVENYQSISKLNC